MAGRYHLKDLKIFTAIMVTIALSQAPVLASGLTGSVNSSSNCIQAPKLYKINAKATKSVSNRLGIVSSKSTVSRFQRNKAKNRVLILGGPEVIPM